MFHRPLKGIKMLNSKSITALFLAASLLGTTTLVAGAQEATTTPAAETPAPAAEPAENNGLWQNLKAKFGGRKDGGRREGLPRDMLMEADADKNGAITLEEINAYRAAKVTAIDVSKDGEINLEEFTAGFNALMKDRTARAFQRLDADASGSITSAELDTASAKLIERMDRNGDGAISKEDRPQKGGKREGGRDGNREGKLENRPEGSQNN